MNKTNLKAYAPQARRDFIAAVAARANLLGISAAGAAPASVRGDLVIIEGREWPAKVNAQREKLVRRIERRGFEQAMEEVAYTWFNRFAALRFMELHGYLDHGWRVLSSRDGGLPEILRHASEVSLPDLNAEVAREMQLTGTQDNELYKLLLVAQCNDLSRSMPFLFERIDDETELLLPDHLLRTDSILVRLISSVPEEDWAQIEVVGWLYQFYISEKKDEVIGKVVQSEDIPAATQLFTPNWIVRYLVQNSVGRLWLMANPSSSLKSQFDYYVDPPAQSDKVTAQIEAKIRERIEQDGARLNPESIRLLDPACGSGHILVEAYETLKAIYLECGYRLRDIPRLILEKNLYGIDIDDRAAQLAGFALLMKARADDRRLLSNSPTLNVFSMSESKGLDVDELSSHLGPFGVSQSVVANVLDIFALAKSFGSLIQIPAVISENLAEIYEALDKATHSGDLYARAAAADLWPFVRQARVLSMKFDLVVANPPYMGGRNLPEFIKSWAEGCYPSGRADLYAMFILRAFQFARSGTGISALVTMQSWMFISSFFDLRQYLISSKTVQSLVQIGFNSFPEMNSKIAQACAFVFLNDAIEDYVGAYIDLNSAPKNADKSKVFLARDPNHIHPRHQTSFAAVPGSPFAYWASDRVRDAWQKSKLISAVAEPKKGLDTGENDRFLRRWFEISVANFTMLDAERASGDTYWVPVQKGGSYRRWFGNHEFVVDWRDGGAELRAHRGSSIRNERFYGKQGATWSTLTSSNFAMRECPPGFIFESKGAVCFPKAELPLELLLAFGNSKVAQVFFEALSQTMDYHEGPFGLLPYREPCLGDQVITSVQEAVAIARDDWNSFEESWDFSGIPAAWKVSDGQSLQESWEAWARACDRRLNRLREIEETNNRLFLEIFDLQDQFSPSVSDNEITLARANRESDCQRLMSYAIGCMMGRYSVDRAGLVYAHAGNCGFDSAHYETFSADDDGIVAVTDTCWFEDDAARRVTELVGVIWGPDTLDANMEWLAESLKKKPGETPDETVRRFLADKFYAVHVQAYKKRPIYWLFSSGKQRAFQALVYMHRYNEGTLARMRAQYVAPLIAKIAARMELLDRDAAVATSTAARVKIQRQIDTLRAKQAEILTYDEKLRHYADMRVEVDLDDGVRANYAKFGDLVADSRTITGGSDE
ncbi:BREX-1 system adenine-specific DNA-methyltransferase PglX [Paraburkholderia dioscoreae]|uniref:site-specific DNA-methyltransferase (adenine-specific) n=1 Tax=Paraburkholderia dioscoreae TaxID=2604047 RepID=A0A5Q4ZED1_9BURK|nr:BREX-1 system adenine-specific DNA-methyltransferase PglX [Paraburkholderia dioscoreae]VVD29233.1 Class I SAM-dependent DNA methyltransferase [Paraburkholderia dioscoreae]